MIRRAAILAAAAILAVQPACAEGTAIIYNFDGKTSVVRNKKTLLMDLDQSVRPGDRMRTEEESFLDVIVNEVVGIRLEAVTEATVVNTNEGNMHLRLHEGSLTVNMKRLPSGATVTLESPTLDVLVRAGQPAVQFVLRIVKNAAGKRSCIASAHKGTIYGKLKTTSATVTILEGHALEIAEGLSFVPPIRPSTDEEISLGSKTIGVYVPEPE